MSTPCPACDKSQTAPELTVCYSCRDTARRDLDIIVTTYDELLEPRSRTAGRRGKGNPQPSPMSDRVGALRFEIRDVLLAWAGHLNARIDAHGYTNSWTASGELPAVVAYLRTHEHVLLADDQAPGYVTALHQLVRDVEKVNGVSQIGVVIAIHSTDQCDAGTVRADSINGTARCSTCGHRAPLADWYATAPANRDVPLTDAEALAYVAAVHGRAVSPATIRSWRHRGHVPTQSRRALDDYLANPV